MHITYSTKLYAQTLTNKANAIVHNSHLYMIK